MRIFLKSNCMEKIKYYLIKCGKGKIILDQLHSEPTLVTEDVFEKIKSGLHPYVVDFIKMALSENR